MPFSLRDEATMPLFLILRNPSPACSQPSMRFEGRDIVIGAAAEADWVLPDPEGRVAPRHCQIGIREGVHLIADLGGPGTQVNGRRMDRPQRIAPDDVIGVGLYEIIVRTEAAVRPVAAAAEGAAGATMLLTAAGIDRRQVAGSDAEILNVAGAMLRRLADGIVAMLAARARAKAEMGAEATSFQMGGANPLKTARDGGQALAMLLAPGGGAMPPDRAVPDAFDDLEAHQAATLRAMQGAMAATLDRFSPAAIRARADDRGLLARVLPGARGASLWQAYEREFDGVARNSGDAFVEMFAREFRDAYQRLSSEARRPS